MFLAQLTAALDRYGLILRGGFHPVLEDAVPDVGAGKETGTVLLIGNAGPGMWRAFAATEPVGRNPLDRWTRQVVEPIARRAGGTACYPADGPPYHPFQRWAQRAEPVAPSPLGILIHPTYGLWHAYRAALMFTERLDLPDRPDTPIPCASCLERPCLSACPVGAFTADGYDVRRCVDYVKSTGEADCAGSGCRARHACPVGVSYRYGPEQQRSHMSAFLAAH